MSIIQFGLPVYFLREAYIHFLSDRDSIFLAIGLFLILLFVVGSKLYVYFEYKRRAQNMFNQITELKLKAVLEIIKLNEKNLNPENWK